MKLEHPFLTANSPPTNSLKEAFIFFCFECFTHHRQEAEPHLLGPDAAAARPEPVDDELGLAAGVEVGLDHTAEKKQ